MFTSYLRRAVRTGCLLLSVLGQCWVPMHKDPTLNEVHCGLLTGENKARLAAEFSAEEVMGWRRKCVSLLHLHSSLFTMHTPPTSFES